MLSSGSVEEMTRTIRRKHGGQRARPDGTDSPNRFVHTEVVKSGRLEYSHGSEKEVYEETQNLDGGSHAITIHCTVFLHCMLLAHRRGRRGRGRRGRQGGSEN